MSLIVATIPEASADLPGWLERQLIGLDLASLTAELSAIHALPPDRLSVETVLAGHLEQIYSAGLSGLPRDLLRHLLTHPALLIGLQELVLMQGGPYWDSLARNPAVEALVERGRARLPGAVAPEGVLPAPEKPAVRRAWYSQPWLVSLATAAAVLVAVSLWNARRPAAPTATAWGWDRPGALPQTAERDVYLETLADEAGEWFAKRPDTAAGLARRLNQFRQGCSTLILSEHPPLPEADREWLVERCQKWAGKLDQHLADLEAGKDVEAVRKDADATVEQLIKALRQRAQGAA